MLHLRNEFTADEKLIELVGRRVHLLLLHRLLCRLLLLHLGKLAQSRLRYVLSLAQRAAHDDPPTPHFHLRCPHLLGGSCRWPWRGHAVEPKVTP